MAGEVGTFKVGPVFAGGAEEGPGGFGDIGGADGAGVGRAGVGVYVAG